jgi:hypothetical protein
VLASSSGEWDVGPYPGSGWSWASEFCGPRFGVVYVGGPAGQLMEAQGLSPVLTAWGWQFELQYRGSPEGPTGLVEFVPMLVGLDKGMQHLIGNVLFGVRTAQDFEFVVGPYLSENGVGLTAAVGHTYREGGMNLPVNCAVTTNPNGVRLSLTTGWNLSW